MLRIFMMTILAPAFFMPYSYALDLPDDAFQLLAQAAADPCSICAEQKREQAFRILNDRFIPGRVIKTDVDCRLIKAGSDDNNNLSLSCYPSDALMTSITDDEQLPQVVFTFHTQQKRLVGILETDYTEAPAADPFHSSESGTVYDGRIRLIAYKYGDGPTYNYFQETNTLLIHCRILKLKPVLSK
jgi:hypothetical protein